jgi:hypothetical protein
MRNKYPYVPIDFRPYAKDLESVSSKFAYLGPDDSLNSQGWKCDEFTTDHEGKLHVLFSGCSFTQADGLETDESWAYKLWSDLDNTSGFFNLAELANNVPNLIFDIFKYCGLYGIPNKIYILFPDVRRYYAPKDHFAVLDTDPDDADYAGIASFQGYLMLETLCKANGVDLISTTWSDETYELLGDFETFFKMNDDKLEEEAFKYLDQIPEEDKQYAVVSRSVRKDHPGISIQHGYYKVIKDFHK